MAQLGPSTNQPIADPAQPGRLFVGTSGFAYPGWVPRFYPAGTRSGDLLAHYSQRLPAVELNNTFYQQPSASKVTGWRAATSADFRFVVKAQRGGSSRAMAGIVEPGLPWLTGPYRAFGPQLGSVLFRVPAGVPRNDDRLATLLGAWPIDLPLTLDFQDPSWQVDETFRALAGVGAVWCSTDLPETEAPPTLRRTGPYLYIRLRRPDYGQAAIAAWADRLEPFLDDGLDVFAFFRHDDVGRGGELALALREAVEQRRR